MGHRLHEEHALTLYEMRSRIRGAEYAGPTSGVARGHVQANLVVLPEDYAFDFLRFCVRNPKPCPILEVTDAGSPEPAVMAPGADLRTDLPRYRVYEKGRLVDEPTDIRPYWRDDLVCFLIRVQLHVRDGAARRGAPDRAPRRGPERSDVRDEPPMRPVGAFRRADGRQHAALPGG